MSGAEQVESFNPLLVVIWLTQLLLLGWDWSADGQVRWSIPIIGSFFIIQLYMIWKTNYDQMMEEQRDAQARALGGPMDTPKIQPGKTNINELYKSKETTETSSGSNKSSNQMVNLNPKSAEDDE